MKLHVHTDCYWFSGSETTMLVLLDAATRAGDTQVAFTYRPWPEYDPGLARHLPDGVHATPLELPDPAAWKNQFAKTSTFRRRVAQVAGRVLPVRRAALRADIPRFRDLFLAEQPDLVHLNNGGYPGAISVNAAALAASQLDIPVVYVVNNQAEGRTSPHRMIESRLDRRIARSVTRFVTGSSSAAARLAQVLDLEDDRVRVIPNTIIEGQATRPSSEVRSAFGLAECDRVVAIPARLEVRKGHAVLLDAWSRVVDRSQVPVCLVVAGEGPLQKEIRGKVRSLGLEEHVRMVGHVSNMWDVYAAADVVVSSSIANEDFPIVILEAMAARLPVVATRFAGASEQVVDGVTGRLVTPGHAAELADALLDVLEDPRRATAMGAAARERYEECFTPARAVERYRETWAEAVERRRP